MGAAHSYHLPLYRLQDYFAGIGWTPSRSTQCNILARVHFVVEPLLRLGKLPGLQPSRRS